MCSSVIQSVKQYGKDHIPLSLLLDILLKQVPRIQNGHIGFSEPWHQTVGDNPLPKWQ